MGRTTKKEVEDMIDQVVSGVVDDCLLNISESLTTVITGTVDKVNEDLINMIRRENIKQKDPKGIYKKTEILLYAYPKLKDTLAERQEQIKELQTYGTRKRSGSITSVGSGSPDLRSEMEKVEDAIEKVQNQMDETLVWIQKVESALDRISNDSWFYVITDHYFAGKTFSAISQSSHHTEETIRNQKNRLIRIIETKLFISDYVDNLMIQIGLLGIEDQVLNC